jgi:putative transposase
MGLPRSTFYDAPVAQIEDAEIVARMVAICDEFEAYGYRRVGAALQLSGWNLPPLVMRALWAH